LLIVVATSKDLGIVLSRLSAIETQQRQQTRLLQTIIAALQTSGVDGSYELPEGVILPIKALNELLDLEKALEDEQSVRKLVSS